MTASSHFKDRVKNRLGLSKKASQKYLNRASAEGIYLCQTTHKPNLNSYLNSLLVTHEHDLIIYNRHIIMYSKTDNRSITILDLPKNYYSSVESLKKEDAS